MKNTIKFSIFALALAAQSAFGQQNTLTATTLSAAVTYNATTFALTSATNIVVPTVSTPGSQLWIQDPGQTYGEIATVLSLSGTTVRVSRTGGQTTAHVSGAMVLIGNPAWFYKYSPTGSCTAGSTYVSPWLNTNTGEQWLCSTITSSWVRGWGTPGTAEVTAVVASVAGATAVNGPLQHISGTNAITSFTMSRGWNGEGFCIIPDAAFTATATNNIAIASTAIANKVLCYTWDATNSKFGASY